MEMITTRRAGNAKVGVCEAVGVSVGVAVSVAVAVAVNVGVSVNVDVAVRVGGCEVVGMRMDSPGALDSWQASGNKTKKRNVR